MNNGILLVPAKTQHLTGRDRRFQPAPAAIIPTPTPRRAFEVGRAAQCIVNRLVDAVTLDHEFLVQALRSTCAVDEFTNEIFKVYMAARESTNGISQYGPTALRAHVLRNDFMLHLGANKELAFQDAEIHNVEINTIAAGFATLSTRLVEAMRMLEAPEVASRIPENNALAGVVDGFKAALDAYVTAGRRRTSNPLAAVMMVQPGERNICDQRGLEVELRRRHGHRMARVTLEEAAQRFTYMADGTLLYTGVDGLQLEVGLVYYRSGYSPDDYPTPACWEARLNIETSAAVKVPNAAAHLVGTKKMQQVLAQPGILEKFLSAAEATTLAKTFTRFYSLDAADYATPAALEAVLEQEIYAHPDDWVLKPQREGGGNNYYGADAVQRLRAMSPEKRAGFILMARIHAPILQTSALAEQCGHDTFASVTEFGFYGVFVANGATELVNTQPGYLMRTKPASSLETGVAAGFGLIDVPLFV
ncbi:uncharacterized protein MONBRDRAFT_16669 [Monosiga brevicollis MX1]|uniref:Glutathione synthetase n=1 Tax=Monosiga brevicollis TaxID=81824 RepID=A9UY47_MONBE|nr:uncharacterized protein MONBRDRAFT_16669 [Monosiga brevicollis MX1]EDQ89958.1 predicted protein [Monosiga brevicollis MX1]|eukprot:XP_001745380.1 hypothetical protein [Monosiga brevicollis MX1]